MGTVVFSSSHIKLLRCGREYRELAFPVFQANVMKKRGARSG